jgi:DNA-binding XRE family transcriptional regulator
LAGNFVIRLGRMPRIDQHASRADAGRRVDFLVQAQRTTPLEQIALWRKHMGYTQREAAVAIGCSRQSWQFWETGAHKLPRYVGLAMRALSEDMEPWGINHV